MKKKTSEQDPIFAGHYECIPDGIYQAVAIRHEYSEFFGRRKLYLWFQIIDESYIGTKLFMSFNIPKRITASSKYYKARLIATKGVKPRNNDRMSPNVFKNKAFTIKVRTVVKGSDSKPLLSDDQYSVVGELIEQSVG